MPIPGIGCKQNEKARIPTCKFLPKRAQTETFQHQSTRNNYFSSLLNVQQLQELTTMSEPTADVGHQLITEHEVESAVKRSKSGKAPGCDIIPNEVYKAGEHDMVRILTAIFNQAYREGCVPTEWGQAEICPIYKQKGDFLRCENYRGVSLMSHVCTLNESVLECRLHNIVEERLGPWQHGFRKGVGTTYMIWALRVVIEKHLELHHTLFISFLGLEKAFDRVSREKLWMAMAEYVAPADLQIAIKSTYKTNKSRVSTTIGSGEWFTTESGVRQGSILLPILFVMYMDLVIKEINQNNHDNDFVDDIAQTATSIEKLQERMTRWNESFNIYNLKLNLKKTEVLVLSRTEKEAVVTLDEYQLNQVTTFKYLGCITGSNGHTDEEINGRISKMSQNVGMMYRLLKDRHVPKTAKLMIHMTNLRPILLYGHESWILTKKLKSKSTAAYII